jgi:hypothetical protein
MKAKPKKITVTPAQLRKIRIEGTTVEEGTGDYGSKYIAFKGNDFDIRLELNGAGHTNFQTIHGSRTFDRYGIDDSFYVDRHSHTVKDVVRIINEEIAKVRASQERAKDQELIPGFGWYTTAKGKQEIIDLLKAGKSKTFTPSGFGTGYRMYTGRCYHQWDKRAKPETEAYFGVSPIWLESMDCD